jgi:ADP-ribose pyrophosphatase YjhB (NUDIX family)
LSKSDLPKATCVLVINREGLILAVSRRDNYEDLGLPGGKNELNETCSETAARELFEETGLKAKNLEFIYGDECQGKVSYWCATYIAEAEGKIEPRPGEGVVRWVEPKVLIKGSFGPYNQKLFDFLNINYS